MLDGPLSRTGAVVTDAADWLARARIVNIDHHVSNDGEGAASHGSIPRRPPTCEMVALLIPELGLEIDADIASVLTAGIVQDTHTFSHPNATPRTLRVAADLVEAGAPLSAIHRSIYADKPFSTLALWGRIMAGMAQRRDGRIVHAAMTTAMLAETGTDPVASEGFIDLLASTKAPTSRSCSRRSTPRTRASACAPRHGPMPWPSPPRSAAEATRAPPGCSIDAPLAEARAQLLAECERELDRADARGR